MATQGCSYCDGPADYADAKGAPVCFDHLAPVDVEPATEPVAATEDDWTALIPPMMVDQPEPLAVAPGTLRRLPPQFVPPQRPQRTPAQFEAAALAALPADDVLPYPGPPPKWEDALKKAAEESNWQANRVRKLESVLLAIGVLAGRGDPSMLPAIEALAHNFEGTSEG